MRRTGKILILDDDREFLEIEGALLQHEGFTIIYSDSSEETIELIHREHPDIVLLDLVFPEDPDLGSKVARTIRSTYPDQPIFLLSAINRSYISGIDKEHSDFDEILTKPVRVEHLIELVNRHIDLGR